MYDHVVLGDGLEKVTHPDHANTLDILAHALMAGTTVFGYIDLGVSTRNLPIAEVKLRIDEWKTTGADGIFLDDYGYDFGTGRARQNEAVDYAHSVGMSVIANAFLPEDAFGSQIHTTHNPSGTATSLNSSDFYLYESHQITVGAFETEANWQTKANSLKTFQDLIGFKIFSITTDDSADVYDGGKFFYSWYSALLYGHEATGWGEYLFSADDAIAPFRGRPAITAGTTFTSGVINSSPVFTRSTDLGTIRVDTSTHASEFQPASGVPALTERGLILFLLVITGVFATYRCRPLRPSLELK